MDIDNISVLTKEEWIEKSYYQPLYFYLWLVL